MKNKLLIFHSQHTGPRWYSISRFPGGLQHSVYYKFILHKKNHGKRRSWVTIPSEIQKQQYTQAMKTIMEAVDKIFTIAERR